LTSRLPEGDFTEASGLHVPADRRKIPWTFWLGVVVSLVCLGLAVQGIDFRLLWKQLESARPGPIGLAFGLMVAALTVRALRWRLLFPMPSQLSSGHAIAISAVGQFANAVLPFRLGELARGVLAARRARLGVGAAMATVVADRLLDMLTLLAIGVPPMVIFPLPLFISRSILWMGFVVVVGMAVLWLWSGGRVHWRWGEEWLAARSGVMGRFASLVGSFREGLACLSNGRVLRSALGLSTLAWGLAFLYNVALLYAFESTTKVPLSAALALLVVTNLGSAIPSAPGYIGVAHYLAVLTLSLWLVHGESAMAYAIAWHGIWYLSMLAMGPMGLIYESVSLGRVSQLAAVMPWRAEG